MASDGIESKMSGTNLRPGAVREIADETAANLIELAGVIKWFDVAKGFGFIAPEEGGKDVFVHVTAVQAAGLRSLNEGQRVSFDIEADKRGPKAVNLKVL